MSAPRILIVEDDATTADTVKLYLEHGGFEAEVLDDGRRGLEAARSGRFDLVVLDLMLPGLGGADVCRRLRRESELPVVMLTARTTEDDRVAGLDLGADDYVAKPFSPRELVSRVRAVLRRRPAAAARREIRRGALVLDLVRRTVRVDGRAVEVTATEFELLVVLASAPGRPFRRGELITRVFGHDFDGTDRAIDAHVKNLRRKIEPDRAHPRWIQTVFGVGYRFGPP